MNINWTEFLKPVIPCPCIDRHPFVCDGFPDDSEVIVIGTNPRKNLGVNWWNFWDNSSVFDYCRFSDVYREKGDNLKTGTRGHFMRIRCLHRIKCVETNIYSDEGVCDGGRQTQMSKQIRVLELLLSHMPLKWVIAHGTYARQWTNDFQHLIPVPRERVILCDRHFMQTDYRAIDSICKQIKNTYPNIKGAPNENSFEPKRV